MKILNSLKLGQSAENPGYLKRWQQRTNYFVGTLTSFSLIFNVAFPEYALSDELILQGAQILGGLVVVVNLILTAASSTKIGIGGGTD